MDDQVRAAVLTLQQGNSSFLVTELFQNVPSLPSNYITVPHYRYVFFWGEGCTAFIRSSKNSLSLKRSIRTTNLELREMDIFEGKVLRLSYGKPAMGYAFLFD